MMRNANLISSSINQLSDTSFSSPVDYDGDDIQEEESGWTSYFDDYFSNKTLHQSASKHIDCMAYDDDDDDDKDGSHGGSGSEVSDAASCVAWKYKNSDGRTTRAEALAACSSIDGTQVIHKKLRFKKTSNRHKRSGDYYNDSLEDTASSPVNSPKLDGEICLSIKTKGDQYGYDPQKGWENGLKQQVGEANKSLKEKGLCLAPYSMLINYVG